MVKLCEKKSKKGGKNYFQLTVNVPKIVAKSLNWKKGDDLEIKTDHQVTYAIMRKI